MEYHVKTAPTPKSYFMNGRDFCETAWRSFGGREGKIVENGVINWLPVPTVVNAAFACEMHLKSLLLLEGKPVPKGREGHNLKVLFESLSEKMQIDVSTFCMPKNTPNALEAFLNILSHHKSDFTDIRYFIENNGWQAMSPLTMLTIAENLTTITHALIDAKNKE